MPNTELTQARLKELFSYDADTGVFVRRVNVSNQKAGVSCGWKSKTYTQLGIDYRLYYAHRLAWLYMYGCWPSHQIDHVNGDKHDNRLSNLREATAGENHQNKRAAQRNSRSGLLGVQWYGPTRRWRSMIRVDGKRISLGYYSTPEEAHQKYLEAKRQHHPFNMI